MFSKFDPLAIIGVGLIGGSIAAAVKRRAPGTRIVGIGRNLSRLQQAQALGLIDECSTDITSGVKHCRLVIACTPVDRIVDDLVAAAAVTETDALLTDAGSVKEQICRKVQDRWDSPSTFIGSHPLAGSEKTGFEHADAELFVDRICVVTPTAKTPPGQLQRLTDFWRQLDARVVELSPELHDQALAEASHLPHLMAAVVASALSDQHEQFAATGFRDTTRIAAGDPDLWTGIFLQNRDSMLRCVDRCCEQLSEFREALEQADASRLKMLLETAKRKRDRLQD